MQHTGDPKNIDSSLHFILKRVLFLPYLTYVPSQAPFRVQKSRGMIAKKKG